MAGLPASQVRALYPDRAAFTDRTGSGPRSPGALRATLAEARRRGYAIEDGEVTAGLASVAVPVLDHNGHPVAGLAVTYPAGDADATPPPEVVRTFAGLLSRRLGGRPWDARALRPAAPLLSGSVHGVER